VDPGCQEKENQIQIGKMKGIFWNIRGLNMPGRKLSLEYLIRDYRVDFIGVQETKKEDFSTSFLKNLSCPAIFNWEMLPAKGITGGILLGVREDSFSISNVSILEHSVSCMLLDKKSNFSWRLVVVYGSPYDESKPEFIDELHKVLSTWQGPTVLGGDFNLCRFSSDKRNGRINQRMADCFNDWVNKWSLIEINPGNRKFIIKGT
jgi:exonuclease III